MEPFCGVFPRLQSNNHTPAVIAHFVNRTRQGGRGQDMRIIVGGCGLPEHNVPHVARPLHGVQSDEQFQHGRKRNPADRNEQGLDARRDTQLPNNNTQPTWAVCNREFRTTIRQAIPRHGNTIAWKMAKIGSPTGPTFADGPRLSVSQWHTATLPLTQKGFCG